MSKYEYRVGTMFVNRKHAEIMATGSDVTRTPSTVLIVSKQQAFISSHESGGHPSVALLTRLTDRIASHRIKDDLVRIHPGFGEVIGSFEIAQHDATVNRAANSRIEAAMSRVVYDDYDDDDDDDDYDDDYEDDDDDGFDD